MWGSGYRVGGGANGTVAAIEVGREWLSARIGSVVERGNAGAEVVGGVPGCEGRAFRDPIGSVVRREDVGCDGGSSGVASGDEVIGADSTATELVGLALVVGTPNAALQVRGEFGLDDRWVSRLLRNCCRSSSVLRCWLSDCRLRVGFAIPTVVGVDGRSVCETLATRAEDTERGAGRCSLRADLELPWLEERLCRVRPPWFATSRRPGRDTGGL
jgi:hypothetical protein